MKTRNILTALAFTWVVVSPTWAGDLKDKVGFGFTVNRQKLFGDSHNGVFKFGGNPLNIRFNFKPYMFAETDFGYMQTVVAVDRGVLKTQLANLGAKVGYRLFHRDRVSPLAYIGFGVLSFRNHDGEIYSDGYGALGGGLEVLVHERVGLNLTADYRLTTGDDFDGATRRSGRDNLLSIGAGVVVYISDRRHDKFDDDMQNMWYPSGKVDLEQVEPDDQPAKTQIPDTREQAAMLDLARERAELVKTLAERNKDIHLLKLKLTFLNEQTEMLSEQLETLRPASADATVLSSTTAYLVHYQNALALYREQDYQRAIKTLAYLVQEHPYHSMTGSSQYWLGECLFGTSDYAGAALAFEKAIAMTPPGEQRMTEMSRLMLGLSYWKDGKEGDAELEFGKILQTEPITQFDTLAQRYIDELRMK